MSHVLPIVLTKDRVFAAAKARFSARELLVQRDPEGQCLYRDMNGNPCGVGAAMTDEQVGALKERPFGIGCTCNMATVDDLMEQGLLVIVDQSGASDPAGVRLVKKLQEHHDEAMGSNPDVLAGRIKNLGAFIRRHAPKEQVSQ